MTDPTHAEDIAAKVLGEHAYVPSLARGVSRCACGEQFHGMPHRHRAHVAAALVATGLGVVADAKAAALEVVRLVERDMAEQALAAWRSADARRGLSDHDALLMHADALTRWSERLRMAMNGEDYRADRLEGGSDE